MATNPMQRKARNSFLLGMLLMLVILGTVVAFLFMQLKNYREKEAEEKANSVRIWVLGQNVISGQVITTDMLTQQVINRNLTPSNAIGDMSILVNYSLTDKEGNEIITEYKNNVSTMYLVKNETKYELKQEGTGDYYITVDDTKQYVELSESPIIAKVDMNRNTIITTSMIAKSDEKTTNDLRIQEYNMLELPTQLEDGEYVDVRLALSSGQDYIVVSKKQVEIPVINGVPSYNTILLTLRENEIIIMNNAIVDAYRLEGARLYVNRYKEAGLQDAATTTYMATGEVAQLILDNPNIIQEAKRELASRYDSEAGKRVRENINNGINNNPQAQDNLNAKISESQVDAREARKEYLESLNN